MGSGLGLSVFFGFRAGPQVPGHTNDPVRLGVGSAGQANPEPCPGGPDHEIAKRVMSGAGGVVTFEIETDLEGAMRFIDATTIPYQAPSFGGVESLIELPITMSFWDIPKKERLALGITDSLVRYACGIENAADIISDIDQALARV